MKRQACVQLMQMRIDRVVTSSFGFWVLYLLGLFSSTKQFWVFIEIETVMNWIIARGGIKKMGFLSLVWRFDFYSLLILSRDWASLKLEGFISVFEKICFNYKQAGGSPDDLSYECDQIAEAPVEGTRHACSTDATRATQKFKTTAWQAWGFWADHGWGSRGMSHSDASRLGMTDWRAMRLKASDEFVKRL